MNKDDYVFISYSNQDSGFVRLLSSDLRERGISVWIDRENINPGTGWKNEILKGLEGAAILILVISPNSVRSTWVIKELTTFIESGKIKIIPIIIQDIDINELPLQIQRIQWADFRNSYEEGFNSLLKGLGSISKSNTPLKTPENKSKGYIFISYAEEDADFTVGLKEYLKIRKYAYWDYEESDRNYHSQLFLELEGVIIEASATLSILSESWKFSKWTVKEFFFSEEVGTPVFLLKAKPISPTLAVAGMPFIDFTKDIENGYKKLDKELSRKNL